MAIRYSAVTAAVFACAAVAGASAQERTGPPAGGGIAAEAPVGAGAIRVVRDKASGKLRAANQDEMAELLAAERAQRAARGLPAEAGDAPVQVRQHANGMTSAVLGLDHLVTVKAQRLPDGRLHRTHTHPAHEHPVVRPSTPDNRPTE